MRNRIENPKVFISYAWGSDDHQMAVLAFARKLMGDGVEVVLDKWDLSAGNDTNAFMEKCVNDPSITNVLMLIDPEYSRKADEHTGDVGTETQIISAKVYKEVNQDKFIPVIFERDENGNVHKPVYLSGRYHFDLSETETYEQEYQRLVKTLYGVEIYLKPELGNTPSWVDKPIEIDVKKLRSYELLMGNQTQSVKQRLLFNCLSEIQTKIDGFETILQNKYNEGTDYISLYDLVSTATRGDYLTLLQKALYVENSEKAVASFLEDTRNKMSRNQNVAWEVIRVYIHELFLYTIALYIKHNDFEGAGYLLGKTYCDINAYADRRMSDFQSMFYSGSYHANMDNAVNRRDGKKYYSGTANYWMDNIVEDVITKEDFILADILCYNYCIYSKDNMFGWTWFPLTYIYNNEYNSVLAPLAIRMISKEYAAVLMSFLGYSSLDELRKKFEEIENTSQIRRIVVSYSGCFESAPLLGNFVKAEKIGTRK